MPTKARETNCEDCKSRPQGIFCELSQLALSKLSHEKISNSYKKGQALFYQGNPPFGLYCINHGKIKITNTGIEGKETIVRIATNGDLLGYRCLFSDEPNPASAIILEDAEICFINKKTIHDLIQKEPILSLQIINRLSSGMDDTENRLASMAQKNIRERFAELLLTLKSSHGVRTSSDVIRLNIKLTREEMASMIGTASESLIRLVTEFKNDGILQQDGKVLSIANESKLEEYAKLSL